MKIKNYSAINKSTKSSINSFRKNLKAEYKDLIEINLTNKDGNKFVISPSYVLDWEKKFKSLINISIKMREVSKDQYLTSGYIVSEINSSLLSEGVHSSRKYVEQVIKDIKEGKQRTESEINTLITNYYESLRFILKGPEINEKNIFTLYSLLTTNIKENLIEDQRFYRKDEVVIGLDEGFEVNTISKHINELIKWINEDKVFDIHTKAIIAHYIFENIHPYYDFNGRMGRLLHLWILACESIDKFWELVFLSEAIYSFKLTFDNIFTQISKAKKANANIDLNFFIASMYSIFIKHTDAYIRMKKLVSKMKKVPSRFIRLFIIDIICEDLLKWYTIKDFQKKFPDYSSSLYGKVLAEIRESGLFNIQEGNPIKFKLINVNEDRK